MMSVVMLAVGVIVMSWPVVVVTGIDSDSMTALVDDYITQHHVTRLILVQGQDTPLKRKNAMKLLKQLEVFIRVVMVKDDELPVGDINDWSHYTVKNEEFCAEGCAPYLVVTMARQQSELDTFMQVYQQDAFHRVPWLVVGDTQLLSSMQTRYVALDNQIVFALDSGDADGAKTFSLWEAYKPAAHLSLRTNQVGSWSPARRLRQPGPWEPFGRRTDLTGLHLTVATVPFDPFILTEDKGDGTLKITGNHADLFGILQESLNFTATFYSPSDGAWGALDESTGLMNGMIGQLQRGLADIAVNALDIIPTRSKVVDYPIPLDSFGYWMVMELPGRGADWTSYTSEFDTQSWLLILAVMVIIAVMMHVVSRASPYENMATLSDSAVYVISACCNMGFHYNFVSTSTRILVISLFVTTIIVYTYYTSFLVATFAVIKIKMPFTDLQGVYTKRNDYHLGILGDSSLSDLLRTSKEPFLRNLWKDMLEPNPDDMVPTNVAGFTRMMDIKYVFLTYAPTYTPNYETTKLQNEVFKSPMSWPVQKNSPLLPILNYHFRRWLESGQYSRLWSSRQKRLKLEFSSTRSLGYDEMFTAFALLGLGLFLSLIVTLMEVLSDKGHRETDRKISLANDPYATNNGVTLLRDQSLINHDMALLIV